MAADDSELPGSFSSAQPPPIPLHVPPLSAQPPPIPSRPPPIPAANDPHTKAVEKFQLAMAFIRQAEQLPGSPLEAKGRELLVEAMELDRNFLDPPLLLGMLFFDSDPVKHAKGMVECATRAHYIDRHHREAAGFLADVLEIPDCREHFLKLSQGSFEADEIDDFIASLRHDAEG